MTNKEVVRAFLNGHSGHSLNMSTNGIKLWSYNTVVAQRTFDYGIVFNATKYSVTTSKQTGELRRGHYTQTSKHVPINSQDLEEYI